MIGIVVGKELLTYLLLEVAVSLFFAF